MTPRGPFRSPVWRQLRRRSTAAGAAAAARVLAVLLTTTLAADDWLRSLDHGNVRGFPDYEAANALLNGWLQQYPSVLKRKQIGSSYEKRPIYAYVLGANARGGLRPKVLLTGLTHAREPASLTVLLYFLGRILEQAQQGDPQALYITRMREVWCVPFVNPDSYVENARLERAGLYPNIRKNSRPTCGAARLSGVDINRNFGFHWVKNEDGCSDEYAGSKPFSEPETQALRAACEENDFKAALNFHTYGELLTHPFNYGKQKLPADDERIFEEIAANMKFVLAGTAPETLHYRTSGEMDDWMYGARGIISLSPEVGPESGHFWPRSSLIYGIDKRHYPHIFQVLEMAGLLLEAQWMRRPAARVRLPDVVAGGGGSVMAGKAGGLPSLAGGMPECLLELRLANSGLSASAGRGLSVAVQGLISLPQADAEANLGEDGAAGIVLGEGGAAVASVARVVVAGEGDAATGDIGGGGLTVNAAPRRPALVFPHLPLPRRSRAELLLLPARAVEIASGDLSLCVVEVDAPVVDGPTSPAVCHCCGPSGSQSSQARCGTFTLAGGSGQGSSGDLEFLCDAAATAARAQDSPLAVLRLSDTSNAAAAMVAATFGKFSGAPVAGGPLADATAAAAVLPEAAIVLAMLGGAASLLACFLACRLRSRLSTCAEVEVDGLPAMQFPGYFPGDSNGARRCGGDKVGEQFYAIELTTSEA